MSSNDITIYAFYNNKGGVGKTTLCSNASSLYAKNNPETQVLVIDMCPQANVSQFLLGGGQTGYQTNQKIQSSATRRNIVGFIDWLLKGNSNFKTPNTSYKTQIRPYNQYISDNLFLIAGDSFLESFSLALNYAVINPANIQAWQEYMTAIRRLCNHEFEKDKYKKMVVFIDCNPSFSIYTQMALVSSDKLIIPVMADFSSLEGIKGIFMLLYGLYPSAALKQYASHIVTFNKQVNNFNVSLPIISQFVFNNFTTHEGIATAFGSIKDEIIDFCYQQFNSSNNYFDSAVTPINNETDWKNYYFSDVKDFHSSGKVSSSLGIPIFALPHKTSYQMPNHSKINLPIKNYKKALDNTNNFVSKLL